MVNEIERQQQQGKLTAEQVEAFTRLVLQEKSLASHLKDMTAITAVQSDIIGSTMKTVLGFKATLNSVWGLCAQRLSECPIVQKQVEKLTWNILKNIGRLIIPVIEKQVGDKNTAEQIYGMILTSIENKLDAKQTLVELLKDSAIEALITRSLIQKQLNDDQLLLNRGIKTADLKTNDIDEYQITGNSQRAESLVDLAIQQSNNESDLVASRHDDFRRGANIAQLGSDISTLGTLTPAIVIAKTISIIAGIEKLIVDLVELELNGASLNCVEYLNVKGSEYAFHSLQPSSGCMDRESSRQNSIYNQILVSKPTRINHPFKSAFKQSSMEYQKAVQTVVVAIQKNDDQDIQKAFAILEERQNQVISQLDRIQAHLTEKESRSDEELLLISQSNSFLVDCITLYISMMDTRLAKLDNRPPANILNEVMETHFEKVDKIERRLEAVNLPESLSNLATVSITNVQVFDNNRLKITMGNAGPGDIGDIHIVVQNTNGESNKEHISTVAEGKEVDVLIDIPEKTESDLIVEAWQGERLVDHWVGTIQSRQIAGGTTRRRLPVCGSIPLLGLVMGYSLLRRKQQKLF